MKFVKSGLFLMFLGALLLGCDGTPDLDVRTFNLQHRSGYEAAELISPYVYTDRERAPGTMSALPNAISVRETPDNLEKIARVLEEFDTAISPARLRFQLIEADSFQEDDPAIADVVAELRSLFRFQGYRLLGEAVVTLASQEMSEQAVEQRFLGPEENFRVEARIRMERSDMVRLQPVLLYLEDLGDYLLETSVTVAQGQTVIIGGASAREGGRSFILTVESLTQ